MIGELRPFSFLKESIRVNTLTYGLQVSSVCLPSVFFDVLTSHCNGNQDGIKATAKRKCRWLKKLNRLIYSYCADYYRGPNGPINKSMEHIQCSLSSLRITSKKGRVRRSEKGAYLREGQQEEQRAGKKDSCFSRVSLLVKGDDIKSTEWALKHSSTNGHKWITHIFVWQPHMSPSILEHCPCAVNTTEAVNLPPNLPGFAILPAVHSARQPIDRTLLGG